MTKRTKRLLIAIIAICTIAGGGLYMVGRYYPGKLFDMLLSKESIKERQLDYLKEHEQEIVDFVKSQNPKVESVQIDWSDVRWSEGGLIQTENYLNVYGSVNNIKESSWGVGILVNDDKTVNMDKMFLGSQIRIGGELLD